MKKLLWICPVLSFVLGWFVAEVIKTVPKTTVIIKAERKQQANWFSERTNEIITTFYKNWNDKPLELKFNEELAYIKGNTDKLTGSNHYEIALKKMRNNFILSYFVDIDADYYTKWKEKDTNQELRKWIDECKDNIWSNQ